MNLMAVLAIALSAKMHQSRLERGETAVEPRLHRRERSACDDGDLFERKLLVEAKGQNFAIARLEREHHLGELGGVFAAAKLFRRGRTFLCDFEGPLVLTAFAHLVERGHGALAGEIDDEVARDGEDPGVEASLAVVLRAALQNTDPDLLKEVFGYLALAGQERE